MRYRGPKAKVMRRFGVALAASPKYQRILEKRPNPPGQYGGKGRRLMRNLLSILLLATLPASADIQLPTGFHADVFARELGSPRTILALEDGTVLVSRPDMNDVVALRDRDHDGRVDEIRTAIASIERAHGLAMRGRTLYVAGVKKIVAADRMPDGSFGQPREVVTDLPDGGRHPYRTIGTGPDGKLYVAVGSSCDDCAETNPEHATILQLDPRGEDRRIYARGLRNATGFDWNPATGELWAGDTGEINRIGDGLHYGWPLCAQQSTAELQGVSREKFCKTAEAAVLQIASRNTPSGFVFYRGTQFPEAFRHDAFSLAGDEVVRVRFQDGRAASAEKFATGFAGRLAGATITADGALLLSDGEKGIVYRITYGERAPQAMTSSASETQAPVLAKAFGLENLRGPESVLHDEEQDVYFVSNIDGAPAAKDGKGFIARVTPNGKVAELKFIDGLDAPKGMAIRGAELWIADIDRLHAFDRVTGSHLTTLNLAPHGAVALRDIAIGPDDAVYITDSDVRIKGAREHVRAGDGRVFRLTNDKEIEVIAAGEELRSPSAIEWDGTRFLIAQEYGREVLAWNPGMATKAVMRGPGSFDGMVVLPNGAVIVSSHHDDALHVAYGGGELRPLFARRPSPGGIGFDRKRNRLLIPSIDGDWLEAWTLPPMPPPQRSSSNDGAMEMASF